MIVATEIIAATAGRFLTGPGCPLSGTLAAGRLATLPNISTAFVRAWLKTDTPKAGMSQSNTAMRRAVSRRWQNSQVTVIAIPNTTQSAITAKAATETIPIVFSLGSNPVEVGFVQSLNHPGGNVTGLTALQTAVTAKRLELVHQLIPGITKIAFLVNPANQALSAFDPKRTCNPKDLLRCHFDLAMRRSDRCP